MEYVGHSKDLLIMMYGTVVHHNNTMCTRKWRELRSLCIFSFKHYTIENVKTYKIVVKKLHKLFLVY